MTSWGPGRNTVTNVLIAARWHLQRVRLRGSTPIAQPRATAVRLPHAIAHKRGSVKSSKSGRGGAAASRDIHHSFEVRDKIGSTAVIGTTQS